MAAANNVTEMNSQVLMKITAAPLPCRIWMDSQDEAIETNSIPAKHQNSNIKKHETLENLMPNVITYLLKNATTHF